jgi:hypothetical protein
MENSMTRHDDDAAIAAFIRAKGVTHCPTACAGRTQASLAEPDRLALQRRADELEARREERRLREEALFRFGSAA